MRCQNLIKAPAILKGKSEPGKSLLSIVLAGMQGKKEKIILNCVNVIFSEIECDGSVKCIGCYTDSSPGLERHKTRHIRPLVSATRY